MTTTEGVLIVQVDPEGIGAELQLKPGDRLLEINGVKPVDYIDYLRLTAETLVNLKIRKQSGDLMEFEIEKEPEDHLGLGFDSVVFDGIRTCNNHCIFCFVNQLPPGQRPTLYVKDDDYRLSFLQGSYITLTNLTAADWERIEELHLSPLYISVHATDPPTRQKLLGSKASVPIIDQLKRLAAAGITLHTQAVICPGINDGPILEKTIQDLAALRPQVLSLAIVPVGLTGHRQRLYQLRPFNKREAREVIETIHRYQQIFFKKYKSRFVFAADEWYIIAEATFPSAAEYEGYPQLDNGVGLIRWFLEDLYESLPRVSSLLQNIDQQLVIVTGKATARLWEEVKRVFRERFPKLGLEILTAPNRFFGPSVTVTGLLSGRDLIAAIQNHRQAGEVLYLIPEITLKQGESLFLDGITMDKLREACRPKKVAVVPTRASAWLNWIINKGCVNDWRGR
ncbi:MAG: DUF512 domain-containing protein [Firmicutes bacterium]|nr:DUF512 domain-containing protein [Bacillota bacterium]